ncbi:hypothetical protein DPMN_052792 [Dreissena polymorpha]|uniref:Uncharacterized protein n=1 Tax=Dreissena polymorpha TaxID=45954 RepID=A0A9D4CKA2_DREPO|nr:hypothetical protein DPMN_052792 [Dreissena polymorpha]
MLSHILRNNTIHISCSLGHAIGRSTSRPSEEKLGVQCERVESLPIDELLSAAHNRPD